MLVFGSAIACYLRTCRYLLFSSRITTILVSPFLPFRVSHRLQNNFIDHSSFVLFSVSSLGLVIFVVFFFFVDVFFGSLTAL